MLFIRALGEADAHPIPGSENGSGPFFSPDGKWLAFFVRGTLRKVALSGGAPVLLADAVSNRGGSWGRDDTIVFTAATQGGLSKVSASGGEVQTISKLDEARGEKTHRFPHLLPGGRAVLFTAGTGAIASWDEARIEVMELSTGRRKVVLDGGSSAQYVPSGHLIYAQGGALVAVPFDLARLEVTGTPLKVVDDVLVWPASGRAEFAVSDNGTLVYVKGGGKESGFSLVSVDRSGQASPLSLPRRAYTDPMLSPTGDRLAVTIEAANDQIWKYEFARGSFLQVTRGWDSGNPSWTPDGQRLVFQSNRNGPFNLYSQAIDGSGAPERLTISPKVQQTGRLSPDGRFLVYVERQPVSSLDIWIMNARGEPTSRPLIADPGPQSSPEFSPDGRWLAYVSAESGVSQVWVQEFPRGRRWQISAEAASFEPRWAANGRELFYQTSNGVMAASVTTSPTFAAERPHLVFEGTYSSRGFDVTPDGRRFVMIKAGEELTPTHLQVVTNWFQELRPRDGAK